MKIKQRYIIILFLVFLVFDSYGQNPTTAPKYSNEFLQIGIGADALGKSNSVVASIDGVTSLYWNPAGLANVTKWLEVGAMHSEYFAGIAKYDFIGLAHAINTNSAIGLSFIRFAVDNIPNTTQLIDNEGNVNYDRITLFTAADYAISCTYAKKITPQLRVGGSFKVVHRTVGDFAHSWGFGLDAGAQYDLGKHFKFGLMTRDISSTFNAWIFTLDDKTKAVFSQTGNAIPSNGLELTLPRFILGTQAKYPLGKKGIYLASELDLDITTDGRRNVLISGSPISIDPHIGLEIGISTYAQLRFGIGNLQYVSSFNQSKKISIQPNMGIGISHFGINIDYAYTDIGDKSTALYSHVISLRFKLDKPKNAIK